MKSKPFSQRTLIASSIATALFTFAVSAQEATVATPDSDDIEHLVVTATGFEQKITEAPASISVISQEDLQSRQFITLLDAVQFQEGIDIGTTRDKTGQGSVSMRGLTGEYTLLLIDGVRMNNHGDIYPNNFGGNAFGHVPPMEAIERIEVIRGPASTLYGADALGGVINVITKKRSEEWGGSINFGRSIQTDDQFGDDITTDFFAQGPLIKDLLSLGVRGSMYERQASNPEFAPDIDPNGDVHIRQLGFGSGGKTVDSDSAQYGFTLFYTPFENQSFKFDYDNSNQTYDNTPSYNLDTGEITYPLGTRDNIDSIWADRRGVVNPRAGYADDQEFNREWWSITHQGQFDGFSSMIALSHVDTSNDGRTLPLSVTERLLLQEMYDGTGAYEGLSEEERKGIAEDTFLPRPKRPLESSQYTLDVRVDIPVTDVMGDHNIVLGGQMIDGELRDGVFGLESSQAGQIQEQNMWSLFAEDNWSPNDYLTLTAGARYDKHDVFGTQVSPRLYAVYTFNDNWTVKGGVSTGYKTPNTTDLYDGITGFGGQGTSPFAGNPDLQPETSVNSEIAAYWTGDAGHNFNITYFNTRFDDKIARGDTVYSCEVTGGVRPCVNLGEYDQLGYETYSQKINIDKVDLQGIEVAGRYQFSTDWFVTANYTWTDSEQKSGPEEGQPLTNTAEHMANITVNWDVTDALGVYLQSQLRSDRYRGWDSVLNKPLYYKNYQLLTLGARYTFNEYVTVNARINNLLDEDFTSYTTEYTDLNGDGTYEYVTGRGAVSEVVFQDDYNIKDRARNLWVGVNVKF
ncbi:TonB-dependent receptor domain-containing protein [Alteromonas confluentis]|uniref:TonB-dependent receptor n=1 Tax=Alteromonas confluentis TaxID=1656094 RepID=A0A1E7ZGC2_9ALTE|nr:TonB-dependent receptor [Alteromonas confluentis]OFC72556.1 TonB-dependent receptor [Alteromonas confluentis]